MRISLGFQVLIAALLAIFFGLFFGPLCSALSPVSNIYAMLLQMVALPYIAFSVMHGLGSLTPSIGKKLVSRGWIYFIFIWLIMFFMIYLFAILIPKTSLLISSTGHKNEADLSEQFLNYLIPANPIYDFANNIVPAVAIFSVVVGVAIMYLDRKEPLLGFIERIDETMEKIFNWLALVSPIGVFAHISVAVGTVSFIEISKVQFYVISFILISLIVTFWILPSLIASFTVMRYKEIFDDFRMACFLAFATGLPTIAFPFINKAVRRIAMRHHLETPQFKSKAQTVVPLSFSFAQAGNFLMIFFLLYLSFYYRHPFSSSDQWVVNLVTIPMTFGTPLLTMNAISFLLHQLGFSDDAFALFMQTELATLNFQVLMSTASILTCSILVLFAYFGSIRMQLRRFFFHFLPSFVFVALAVLLFKPFIHLDDKYRNVFMELDMEAVVSNPPKEKIVSDKTPITPPIVGMYEPLSHILKTGVLRVGYDPVFIPYSYLNDKGDLVGFDIAFAYELAKDLDVRLEFFPINWSALGDELQRGEYDIAMAGVQMSEDRLIPMDFTKPYSEQYNVLIVPVSKIKEFSNFDLIALNADLKLGGVGEMYRLSKRNFPKATVIDIGSTMEPLIQGKIDAYMSTTITAFIWCLEHPEFTAVDYGGRLGKSYYAYAVRSGSVDTLTFINAWLDLKTQSGFKQEMIDYWIEGIQPNQSEPRWSILRNVLGWIQ